MRWNRPRTAMGRFLRWWASRAWGSPAWSINSFTRRSPRAGGSCGPEQRPTAAAPASIREKVTVKLLSLDARLLPLLPTLLILLDLPPEDHQSTLDPPQHRQRTLEAVKRLLFRESEAQPVLVVIESLHAIDLETQVLVDGLIDSLAA